MPELPEVETISRQLNKSLVGEVLSRIEVVRKGSFLGDQKVLLNKKIGSIERRGKMVVFYFSDFDKVLVVHLKMTGQLIYIEKTLKLKTEKEERIVGGHPSPDWVNDLPSKHTRVIINFSGGSKLYFNDMRAFGWMKIMNIDEWKIQDDKMPPDVTSGDFSFDYFSSVMTKSTRNVKLSLLDQAKIGGVGNIYANEALYLAKVHPLKRSCDLSKSEVKRLHEAVIEVIENGVKFGGASIDNYVNAVGRGGEYQNHFLIYKREGETCERDGQRIKKIKIGGRGSYFCAGCQKLR